MTSTDQAIAARKARWARQRARVDALLLELDIKFPRCGFEIGEGWFTTVAHALRQLVAAGWDRELEQVKQKFCGLRIYLGDSYAHDENRPEFEAIIRHAEYQCAQICEFCGEPHFLTIPRSGMALCKECEKEPW